MFLLLQKSYKAAPSADGEYPIHTSYRNLTFSLSGMIGEYTKFHMSIGIMKYQTILELKEFV